MAKSSSAMLWGKTRVALLSVGALAMFFTTTAPALRNTVVPENRQTKNSEPTERSISLRLPLEQADFHWMFRNRDDFLAGKLLLRITRAGKTDEILIFERGKISDGWQLMPPVGRIEGGAYFGFVSTRKYPTAPGDRVEIELTVARDLDGIGPTETGMLPARKYTAKGAYSLLLDEFDTSALVMNMAKKHPILTEEDAKLIAKMHEMNDYKAFLETWADQWPLKITGDRGWLPPDKAAASKAFDQKAKADESRRKRLDAGSSGG